MGYGKSSKDSNKAVKIALLAWPVVVVVLLGASGLAEFRAHYQWESEYGSAWSLADKSSTISAKLAHLERFVAALEESGLRGTHNAIVYPTPDNSFDANLDALRTLVGRLSEMQEMDPNGFAYQTAIQQVTEQEQGEAGAMLDVFKGCWRKDNYMILWDWVGVVWWFILIFVGISSACLTTYLAFQLNRR